MECEVNKEWMLKNCKSSCNQCEGNAKAAQFIGQLIYIITHFRHVESIS